MVTVRLEQEVKTFLKINRAGGGGGRFERDGTVAGRFRHAYEL